jgi:hypothetical protein
VAVTFTVAAVGGRCCSFICSASQARQDSPINLVQLGHTAHRPSVRLPSPRSPRSSHPLTHPTCPQTAKCADSPAHHADCSRALSALCAHHHCVGWRRDWLVALPSRALGRPWRLPRPGLHARCVCVNVLVCAIRLTHCPSPSDGHHLCPHQRHSQQSLDARGELHLHGARWSGHVSAQRLSPLVLAKPRLHSALRKSPFRVRLRALAPCAISHTLASGHGYSWPI